MFLAIAFHSFCHAILKFYFKLSLDLDCRTGNNISINAILRSTSDVLLVTRTQTDIIHPMINQFEQFMWGIDLVVWNHTHVIMLIEIYWLVAAINCRMYRESLISAVV